MPVAVTAIITLALAFYTVGVWSTRFQGRSKPWHLAMGVLGLAFDTVGTGMTFNQAGGLTWDLHELSGLLAIGVMLLHAVWADAVPLRRAEAWPTRFHDLSVGVWLIWLVPYFSPTSGALGSRDREAFSGRRPSTAARPPRAARMARRRQATRPRSPRPRLPRPPR